jgi:hypothetical protein
VIQLNPILVEISVMRERFGFSSVIRRIGVAAGNKEELW